MARLRRGLTPGLAQPILSYMVNYQARLDRTFAALVDPTRRAILARLEREGRRAGRARRPAETPREYAAALANHLHDERIRTVGETVDADGFSATGASSSARASSDAVLSSLKP